MPQHDLSNYRTVVYIVQRKPDEDYKQRFMVLGESSKMAMDVWFYFSLKKVGKESTSAVFIRKNEKEYQMKSDAFEKKRSRNKELYVRYNSSVTQPYTRCSTCSLTPLLWVHTTLSPTSLW